LTALTVSRGWNRAKWGDLSQITNVDLGQIDLRLQYCKRYFAAESCGLVGRALQMQLDQVGRLQQTGHLRIDLAFEVIEIVAVESDEIESARPTVDSQSNRG